MKASIPFLRLTLALFSLATVCRGQVSISTFSSWNGTGGFGSLFGEPGPNFTALASYGQTFTVPAGDPTMTSFSIWMHDNTPFDPDPMVFGGYVMQWTGQHASGPVLYDSGPITLGTGFTWHRVSFNSLNLALTPGQKYVFIVSASKYFNGLEDTASMAGLAVDAYSAGAMVDLDNGTDISQWTTQNWGTTSQSWDTVFTAQFDVPEPPGANLFVIGLIWLVFGRIRRESVFRTLK